MTPMLIMSLDDDIKPLPNNAMPVLCQDVMISKVYYITDNDIILDPISPDDQSHK